jgi:hypothetical protein
VVQGDVGILSRPRELACRILSVLVLWSLLTLDVDDRNPDSPSGILDDDRKPFMHIPDTKPVQRTTRLRWTALLSMAPPTTTVDHGYPWPDEARERDLRTECTCMQARKS